MWEPVGPLPTLVYQRRRRIAAAAVSAATLLVVLTGALMLAPEPTVQTSRTSLAGAADVGAPGNLTRAADTRATMAADAAATVAAATATTGAAGHPGGFFAAAAPTSVTGTPEVLRPDNTPRPAVPVPSPVKVPPTGPVPCTNGMIKVAAEIDAPDHRVGDRPVLRLVITGISPQPCVRDLDASRQEIVVWSGDGRTRLWSSNDCGNPGGPDLRTLVPQQPVVSAVTWAGRTSAPGCAAPRTVVPAGAYRVLARLDDIISAPTPFLLTAAG